MFYELRKLNQDRLGVSARSWPCCAETAEVAGSGEAGGDETERVHHGQP
jgi:hypothetical protein